MEQQIRILIADTSEAVRESLRDCLSNRFQLQLCCDGRTAMELLRRFQPDVLVLDLLLPGFDGLSLLQAAADAGIHPIILATTRQQDNYILDTAYRLGVSYIMMRPCDINAMTERIMDLAGKCRGNAEAADLTTLADRLLIRLGFASRGKSYSIILDAVVWLADNPGAYLSKELYPWISKRYRISSANAEKKIRYLIRSTCNQQNSHIWQLYFPAGEDNIVPCPSNGTFLTRIVQCLPSALERSAKPDV